MQSREFAASASGDGGASPSGQFAGIHIDSGSSMSGSEHGGNTENRAMNSPNRTLSARSASPAKRSAADMEDVDAANNAGQGTQPVGTEKLLGGHGEAQQDEHALRGAQNSTDTQETLTDNVASSQQATFDTAATTMQSDQHTSQPEEQNDDAKWRRGSFKANRNPAPPIDEQVKQVLELTNNTPLDEGSLGYVVSTKWLSRVMSRSTEGMSSADYPKEAKEGEIGPVDNFCLVPEGGMKSELRDVAGKRFVPLKPGLQRPDDFEVVPEAAWGKIHEWYNPGVGNDQSIVRHAHNTAEPPNQHIQYEVYPPIITIRRVPQPGHQVQHPTTPSGNSSEALRIRQEQRARGQTSSDDAIRLVSSRSERFHKFLARAKQAAGVPLTTKVKVFRQLDPENVAVNTPDTRDTAMPSPPESRSTPPAKAALTTAKKLIVPQDEFKGMEIGKDLEHIDVKDNTGNEKYNGSSTVEIYGIFEDQTLLLEEQIGGPAGGEFQSDSKAVPKITIANKAPASKPGSAPASGRASPTSGGPMTRGRTRRDGRTRGTVGLSNLGNTCYMNSALQCIRSVEELAVYFLQDKYKSEINNDNPLGHNGAMASQYAKLLQGIYADNASGSFTPSAFKRTLGNLQPLFSGYGQQDSQEFLSFLVDALHEDLNRIYKKPYLENPDSDDKTVHDPKAIIELGNTYRANHKARNDSVAMDLFNGFYKNTMECPECDKVSVTFDPFSLVTLQLPIENTFQHTVTFVPLWGAPINHDIDIDKNASIKTLKENIASKHPGVTADRLWMVEVYNHRIYKLFENHHTIAESGIQSNDYVFVFELSEPPTNTPEPSKKSAFGFNNSVDRAIPDMDSPKAERFAVPVFSRQRSRYGNSWDIILHPLYIMLTREEAKDYDVILKKVLLAVQQVTSRPILEEFDSEKEQAADEPMTNGTHGKGEAAGEEAAQVSDKSVPSEDGYVDISIGKPTQANGTGEKNGANAAPKRLIHPVPARFMESDYFIVPALRSQMFDLGYAKSAEGAYCTGVSSIQDKNAGVMHDRVVPPTRRSSVHSSASDASEASTRSGQNAENEESEESDADDDEDKPDIVQGNEDTLHMQTPTSAEAPSDDDFPADPLAGRGGRRRQPGKKDKFAKNRKGKLVTYGKKSWMNKNRRQQRTGTGEALQSSRSLTGKEVQDESPYYIKLGEAIVLDWKPEAIDSLFGGDSNTEGDFKGQWLSSPNGSKLDFMPDPVLEAKRKRRADRKRNGVTLEDCFVESGKREVLSEDNAWYCNRCKELRQAAKTLEIWTIPDILIVHLKRFGGNRSFRDKVDVFVDYPIEGLDMTEKIGLKEDGKEYVYDLFAVDNHYGGLGGGHYTALAKNFYDGQWYDYNGTSFPAASNS